MRKSWPLSLTEEFWIFASYSLFWKRECDFPSSCSLTVNCRCFWAALSPLSYFTCCWHIHLSKLQFWACSPLHPTPQAYSLSNLHPIARAIFLKSGYFITILKMKCKLFITACKERPYVTWPLFIFLTPSHMFTPAHQVPVTPTWTATCLIAHSCLKATTLLFPLPRMIFLQNLAGLPPSYGYFLANDNLPLGQSP